MNYERWRSWIEGAGISAVILGLLFVGYEIRQSRDLSLSERFISGIEVEVAIRATIADNASLWRRRCIGEELSDDEQVVFTQLVYAIYFKQFMKHQIGQTTVGDAAEDVFILAVARNMHRFPGFAESVRSFQTISWTPEIEATLNELKQDQPNPIADPSTCGI